MFTMYADSMTYGITMVQSAKKEWVKQFIKDEKIAAALTDFVESQTSFAKQLVKTGSEIGTELSKEIGKFPNFTKTK